MDMDNMWEKIKKSLKEGAVLSVEKIEEYTKIGKLKVEEMSAKRKIERNFHDIGERYYDLTCDGREDETVGDPVIKKCLANIESLYDEVADIAEKIKEVHRTSRKCCCSGDADTEDTDAGDDIAG